VRAAQPKQVSYADLGALLASSELVGADTVVALEYPVELGSLPPVIDTPAIDAPSLVTAPGTGAMRGLRLLGVSATPCTVLA